MQSWSGLPRPEMPHLIPPLLARSAFRNTEEDRAVDITMPPDAREARALKSRVRRDTCEIEKGWQHNWGK